MWVSKRSWFPLSQIRFIEVLINDVALLLVKILRVEDALRLIVCLADGSPSTAFAGELRFGLDKLVIGVAQKNQP